MHESAVQMSCSTLSLKQILACSGHKLEVWTLSAKDGEVLKKKQEELDAPLMGPVICKGGFAYTLAAESYWLCRMELAGVLLMP